MTPNHSVGERCVQANEIEAGLAALVYESFRRRLSFIAGAILSPSGVPGPVYSPTHCMNLKLDFGLVKKSLIGTSGTSGTSAQTPDLLHSYRRFQIELGSTLVLV